MKLILFLFSMYLSSTDNPKPLSKIGVLYYTFIDANLRVELLKNITATYHCTVTEIAGIATIPKSAYYKPRNRYRAAIVLKELNIISGFDRIIGITSKDISDTKDEIYDWGIMGLGSCPGKSCVISTFRIKTPDQKLFKDRFIKNALENRTYFWIATL